MPGDVARELRRRTDGARILLVEDNEDFCLLMQILPGCSAGGDFSFDTLGSLNPCNDTMRISMSFLGATPEACAGVAAFPSQGASLSVGLHYCVLTSNAAVGAISVTDMRSDPEPPDFAVVDRVTFTYTPF